MSNDLTAAIELAEKRGFAVFPLWPNGKTPANANGCAEATKDPARIAELWKGRKGFNIGVEASRSGLVLIDVDTKKGRDGYKALARLTEQHGNLPKSLRVKTTTGGLHIYFKKPEGVQLHNLTDHPLIGEGLEMRVDNQYLVAPPSTINDKPYEWIDEQADIAECPKWLIDLNQAAGEKTNTVRSEWGKVDERISKRFKYSARDVIDRYNRENRIESVLQRYGYSDAGEGWLHHPNGSGSSGSVHILDDRSYHFGASDPLRGKGVGKEGRCLFPFNVVCELQYNGDFKTAIKAIAAELGMNEQEAVAATSTGTVAGAVAEDFKLLSIDDIQTLFAGDVPTVIEGLIHQGEVTNVIGGSKSRKTWLMLSLMLSVATGREWLGFATQKGKVLHIDNELKPSTLRKRLNKVATAMGLTPSDIRDSYRLLPVRGKLLDVNQIYDLLRRHIKKGEYSLIIIDALYKTLPPDVRDENDNAGMTRVYCKLDQIAETFGAGVIVVHHQSKGSQANKKVTDVGAGAGAQSRSADNHIILREHAEIDNMVMEAVARDFPPLEPKVLSWEYPIYQVNHAACPNALRDKDGATPTMSVEDFANKIVSDQWEKQSVLIERAAATVSKRTALTLLDKAEMDGVVLTRGGRGGKPKEYMRVVTPKDEDKPF